MTATVSVVIAAHDCDATIGLSIRSALREPETAEVVVVDDASSDGTRAVVLRLADGDERVRVVPLDRNVGPGGARNRGIDAATGTFVAILDSDDAFVPGRLSVLLAEPDWDMAADNVVFLRDFVSDPKPWESGWTDVSSSPRFETIDPLAFVSGNLPAGRRARGELGFLKPLVSKAYLDRHDLRYDETLRLGEDYDLYVRMLLAGARFQVTRRPGYLALVRGGSLSARHSTKDLGDLAAAAERHVARVGPGPLRDAMLRLRANVRGREAHRRFLDVKASSGLAEAFRFGMAERGRIGPVLRAVAADKLRLRRRAEDPFDGADHRFLLPPGG